MSTEQHQPTDPDMLHDRLVDRALAERVGGETPPDLAERILAAAHPQTELTEKKAMKPSRLKRSMIQLAVAASLLIGFGALLLPDVKSVRHGAQISPSEQSAKKPKTLPSPYYMTDDHSYVVGDQFETQSNTSSQPLRPKQIAQESEQGRPRGSRSDASVPNVREEKDVAFGGGLGGAAADSLDRITSLRLLVEPKIVSRLEEGVAGDGPVGGSEYGRGPGEGGDQYTRIDENPFIEAVGASAVSTFSIDVDTASYANVRQFLLESKRLPPADAVRIEELINYFPYDYEAPSATDEGEESGAPFAAHVEVAGCPWTPEHRLVRVGIKGREMEREKRPLSNLVFLIDVSGSMNHPNKLPLVVEGLRQLTYELGENDRVAIVVYASQEGLVLPSTPGNDQGAILAALERLQAGGSTAGGAGIRLAYQMAEDHFIEGGVNRVILCTDGDFNVGTTSPAELERLVEQKAADTGVFLSVLGFGRGNLNDAMMEAISGRGNGNYYYVDNRTEARKVLVEEMTGTLVTIAKDVKIQIEFNPAEVAGYRLIGYENRLLRTEDFNDDTKDAGEIGAGHTVTALYEIVPAGQSVNTPPVDDLKYQQPAPAAGDESDELLTLKIRYKQPDGDTSRKLEWPIRDAGQAFAEATPDCQFAAAVASFGMLLRDSQHKGNATWSAVEEIAASAAGDDPHGYRAEFLQLVRQAKTLAGGNGE